MHPCWIGLESGVRFWRIEPLHRGVFHNISRQVRRRKMMQRGSIHHARFALYNGLGNLDIKQTLFESSGDNATKGDGGKKLRTDATDGRNRQYAVKMSYTVYLLSWSRYVSSIGTSIRLEFIFLKQKYWGGHHSPQFSFIEYLYVFQYKYFSNMNTNNFNLLHLMYCSTMIIFIDNKCYGVLWRWARTQENEYLWWS